MIYYQINIGFSHWKHSNFLTVKEISEEIYKYIIQIISYYDVPSEITTHTEWDFNQKEGTGYIQGVANEDNFETIKEFVIDKAFELLNNAIKEKEEQISKLNSTISRIQEHPIFKSINRDNQIDKILN
jgi:hypothetical protein